MSWKPSDIIDQKRDFIHAVEANTGRPFSSICEAFGISRETGYQLLRRHRELGNKAFEAQSRRPLHSPQAIKPVVEQKILEVRAKHPTWGARKILAYLQRHSPGRRWPVASSIGDVLRRNGLTHPRRSRSRTAPFTQPLGHASAPNDLWCIDFKGWFRTLDGVRCNPLTITDASSRMLLRCHHVAKGDLEHVRPVLEAAFREYGLPLAMRSDNGPPFASKAIAGLSRLSAWMVRLGIWPERIDPGCPEQNGRHERMHGTLQAEVAANPSANLRLQQRALDRFRVEYNHERPHEAIGQRTPADLYAPSPREFPERLPEIVYPSEAIVRVVKHTGDIKHQGERYFLSEALAGECVALWEVEGGWDVYFSVIRLARLDARTGRLVR
jgi:transposase InsO family protein